MYWILFFSLAWLCVWSSQDQDLQSRQYGAVHVFVAWSFDLCLVHGLMVGLCGGDESSDFILSLSLAALDCLLNYF